MLITLQRTEEEDTEEEYIIRTRQRNENNKDSKEWVEVRKMSHERRISWKYYIETKAENDNLEEDNERRKRMWKVDVKIWP